MMEEKPENPPGTISFVEAYERAHPNQRIIVKKGRPRIKDEKILPTPEQISNDLTVALRAQDVKLPIGSLKVNHLLALNDKDCDIWEVLERVVRHERELCGIYVQQAVYGKPVENLRLLYKDGLSGNARTRWAMSLPEEKKNVKEVLVDAYEILGLGGKNFAKHRFEEIKEEAKKYAHAKYKEFIQEGREKS